MDKKLIVRYAIREAMELIFMGVVIRHSGYVSLSRCRSGLDALRTVLWLNCVRRYIGNSRLIMLIMQICSTIANIHKTT